MKRLRLDATDIARIAVFAAVVAALGLPGGFSVLGAVPITAQTLGVMLAGAVLGAWRGMVAMLVLLALVAIGLPLLSGGRGGVGVFVGPSAGYLIGWVAGAFVIGLVVHAGGGKPRGWRTALGVLVGGIGVVYAFGIPVQALVTRLPLGKTFLQSLVFLPGDLIKAALATVVTTNLARAYPRAFRNAGWARHRDVVPGEPPRASAEDRPGTGRIVPLRGGDPAALARRAVAERAAGGIPLIGDDRWSESAWAAVTACAAASRPRPDQAWATLTSGSTGEPRVVLRTAASWESSFASVGELLGVRQGDVLGLSAPPASSLSLFSVAHAAHAGLALSFPRGRTLAAGDLRDATLFHGTPGGLRTLLHGGPPPRLRAALIGGAALAPSLRAEAEARGIRVIAYYGAAELSFVAVDDGEGDRPGLRAFPGVALDVRDDGVLWVRSPFVASGYLGRPGPLRRDGAWATVGDRARLDEGRLTLLGRADDAILTAGATVVPADVEEAVRELDGVADAVVFGVPHAGVGELVTVVVEPAPGARLTRAGLRTACAAVLAPSHLPRRWFVMDALPRTVTGKPSRAELIRAVRAGEVAGFAN